MLEMHDPWDVTTTRRSDVYISCMKINGVPLLPPVLSKEGRKEMQYYKALALEVEKRISLLKAFVDDSEQNKTECDKQAIIAPKLENTVFNEGKVLQHSDKNYNKSHIYEATAEECESLHSNVTVIDNSDDSPVLNSPKLVIGVIDDIFKDKLNNKQDENDCDTPERDYNCLSDKFPQSSYNKHMDEVIEKENVSPIKSLFVMGNEIPSSPVKLSSKKDLIPKLAGPPSLGSSKSFDDIHAELSSPPKMVRQRSYTILNPGPALLAHLEVQSLTSGVDMSSISMSESCCDLSCLAKKRKNWDLETAKVKWSSMATELNKNKSVPQEQTHLTRPGVRAQSAQQSNRARSAVHDRPTRRTSKSITRVVSKTNTNGLLTNANKSVNNTSAVRRNSPTRKEYKADNAFKITTPVNSRKVKEDLDSLNQEFRAKLSMITTDNFNSQLTVLPKNENLSQKNEDPSICIKELYEKIRNQQLLRMATLIEKQEKEKQLLQQVFEEQNSLFYKQLKTICPTASSEIKEAWTDKSDQNEPVSQPVSLSQLINEDKESDASTVVLSSTLDNTQDFIDQTDEIIKKGRNVRQNSASKSKVKNETASPHAVVRPKYVSSCIPRRGDRSSYTTDLANKGAPVLYCPRKHFASESSSSREMEPVLTDRTDNTMADLNFTLTSDDNADYSLLSRDCTFIMKDRTDQVVSATKTSRFPVRKSKMGRSGSIDCNMGSSYKQKEYPSKHSPKSHTTSEKKSVRKLFADRPSNVQELAASRIVAYARGYLTRRLLRTERVQSTVQTIRDALVCALQLHQDRDGIRGADVDLHRRLIQQITAACYSLHDTFIVSSPQERCALIAQDRERQRALEEKQMSSSYSNTRSLNTPSRRSNKRKSSMDVMWHSHSGVLGARPAHTPPPAMARSSHEMYSGEDKFHRHTPKKYIAASKELHTRRPWR